MREEQALAPTPKDIGNRIEQAINESTDKQLPKPKKTNAAVVMEVTEDTLTRYIKGETDPSALQVWRLANKTGRPFGWFGDGGDSSAEDRLAAVAESVSGEIDRVAARLTSLLDELHQARRDLVEQSEMGAAQRADRKRKVAATKKGLNVSGQNS